MATMKASQVRLPLAVISILNIYSNLLTACRRWSQEASQVPSWDGRTS